MFLAVIFEPREKVFFSTGCRQNILFFNLSVLRVPEEKFAVHNFLGWALSGGTVPECRQFWFWWNRLSWDCHYWAQHSDPSQSLILSNSKIYHLNLECCLLRGLMRLKTKKTGNILRTLEIYVLVKCRAIMVERAPETGVDPLMKFSSQKNTFPPGAQSSTWRHKQSPKELGVLPENLPQLQKIECSLPFLE